MLSSWVHRYATTMKDGKIEQLSSSSGRASTCQARSRGWRSSQPDDRAEQTDVRVEGLVNVAVVPPHDRARIVGTGGAPLVSRPVIVEGAAGGDCGPGAGRDVVRAFVRFVVPDAVRVDAVRAPASVLEVDENLVSHFGADDRTEYAEPGRLGLRRRERGVHVLDVPRLLPLRSVGTRDATAVDEVLAGRGEVPDDVLGSDEVLADRRRDWRDGDDRPEGEEDPERQHRVLHN